MNTSLVQSTLNCPSSYNASVNSNSIALTLDQTQLQQITQLMNEMQQQELTFNAQLNVNNNSTENANITIDVNHADHNINQNQLIFSPDSIVKLESQIQFQQHSAYQMGTQSNQIVLDNHQQQLQQQQQHPPQITQVHTIMLNGQPALFIPASSAMSSNLLSQMLMNNNCTIGNSDGQSSAINTNSNNNNQTFDLNSLSFNSGWSLKKNVAQFYVDFLKYKIDFLN